MKRWLLIAALVAIAGCGSDDDAPQAASAYERPTAEAESDPAPAAAAPAAAKAKPRGTRIVLRSSEFGPMLFDARRQAIYIFENDSRDKTVCYGECAEAWPPVYTRAAPRAGKGVRASLLGTIKRRDGRRQVTYAGQPLYFYAHEDPGQVLCHNVDLNGGLWWVVGRDGRRRP
jgi:predicted lipoprotein with Yx(FWY)xxD motif